MRRIAVAFAALVAIAAPTVRATQLDASAYEKKVEITFGGYDGSAPLQNFPALVRVSGANGFDYSKFRLPNGGDLRFADADGNLLSHEVETWDDSNGGVSFVWVKVPELTSSTKITAYYGCATPPAVTAADVWSNGYVGVWHLGESSGTLAESSGRSNPFAAAGTTPPTTVVAGLVGGAVDFTGASTNGRFESADAAALDGFQDLTIEAWTKQSAYPTANAFLLSRRTTSNTEIAYFVYMYYNSSGANTGKGIFSVSTTGTSAVTLVGSGVGLLPRLDEWSHQAYVRDATGSLNATGSAKAYAYMDGGRLSYSAGISDTAALYASSAPLVLGNSQSSGSAKFNGLIDELRISNVARSAAWVKASHDTVAEASFATYEAVSTKGNNWDKYAKRFTVTFNRAAGAETLSGFPALVRICAGNPVGFSYADCQKADGNDLRFADADGNLLASEVDTWNTSGESLVWVKVPTLGETTKITAYYGWAEAAVVDSASVWSEGYVGVWHLGESALPLAESSGNANGFTTGPGNPALAAAGAVGGAVDFSSAASYARFEAPDADALDGFQDLTIEAWTKQSAYPTANAFLLSRRTKQNEEIAYFVYMYYNASGANTGKGIFSVSTTGTSVATLVGSGVGLLPRLDEWSHQAYVRDATGSLSATGAAKAYAYMDGDRLSYSAGISDTAALYASSAPLVLGNSQSSGSAKFNGLIDELRISNVARSAAWVKASHDTVTASSFATYGDAKPNVTATILFFR